jgi:predicted O-methyltransferase YrrM
MIAQELDLFVRCFRANRRMEARVVDQLSKRGALRHGGSVEDVDLRVFLAFLYHLVRHYQPLTVVQVGTFVGASAAAIALGLRDNRRGRLFTIDPEPREYFFVQHPVSIARRVLHEAGLARYVRFVRGYSTVPGDHGRMRLPRRPLWRLIRAVPATYDILVVDGDHTFAGCYCDLLYGALRLAASGPRLIVVHDYLGIADVRRAVRLWRRTHLPSALRVVPSPCGIAILKV